ncbi:MAG: ribosome biogenesis GTP-binding protein YihA/YsxC [Rickettsiaceae bacterium]
MADIGGIKIFRQEAKFVAGVTKPNQLPKLLLPQFAFVGKSNVGKSSLINKICNRRALARVSHTPGRTQQINFFSIADKFMLVDLPGYGFAKVSANQRANWEKLIVYYLENSEHLRMVNLLIDARRGIKANDIETMHLLTSVKKDFQLVFTKADKVGSLDQFTTETQNHISALGLDCNIVITSSKSGFGAKELQASMLRVL